MKRINKISYVPLLCIICVLFFVTGAASPVKDISHYFKNAHLNDKPVLEYRGVSITPLKWGVIDAEERWLGDPIAKVFVEYSVQNNSAENVNITGEISYVNGQLIRSASFGGTFDPIPPGGSGTFSTIIEEYMLTNQRIKTIRNFEAIYRIFFEESKFRYLTDCIPILKNSQSNEGLYPFNGKEVYRDEALAIYTSSEIKELPGAFVAPLHIKNLSSTNRLSISCHMTDLNGKSVSGKDDLGDFNYSYSLAPLKAVDLNTILYIKDETEALQVPVDEITDVTYEITCTLSQKSDTTYESEQTGIIGPMNIKLKYNAEN